MPQPRDAGVATVWAAVVITALAALLAAVVGFGAAVAARHQASAAADLAALAGAARAWSGPEEACAEAAAVAERMSTTLRSCELTGLEITVRVARPFGPAWAEATAKAGPVDTPLARPVPLSGPTPPLARPAPPLPGPAPALAGRAPLLTGLVS
ncbi:Rv3654c family TadE-like protein, partial [Actinokineospora sp. NPDC004072]